MTENQQCSTAPTDGPERPKEPVPSYEIPLVQALDEAIAARDAANAQQWTDYRWLISDPMKAPEGSGQRLLDLMQTLGITPAQARVEIAAYMRLRLTEARLPELEKWVRELEAKKAAGEKLLSDLSLRIRRAQATLDEDKSAHVQALERACESLVLILEGPASPNMPLYLKSRGWEVMRNGCRRPGEMDLRHSSVCVREQAQEDVASLRGDILKRLLEKLTAKDLGADDE